MIRSGRLQPLRKLGAIGSDMSKKFRLAAIAVLAIFPAAIAFGQRPPTLHGTVESVAGGIITVKQASGSEVTVKLADNAKIFGLKAATMADLKPGAWIGVGAMPQPDGTQKAIQVTIFAETQRGVGEGFRPWDRPNSTMTNGTAGEAVSRVDGQAVTVTYKGGEQKIIIGPDATIRMYVVGGKDDLKPGIKVALVNVEKTANGALQTARVNYGIGSIVP